MTDPLAFDGSTSRLGLPLLYAAQAQKEFIVNEALARIDFAVQAVVEGECDDPPAAPQPGQAWIVGSAPSADFIGHAGAIAGWTGSGWRFIAAFAGMSVFDLSAGCRRVYAGAWLRPLAPVAAQGGNTVDTEARDVLANLIEALALAGIFATN